MSAIPRRSVIKAVLAAAVVVPLVALARSARVSGSRLLYGINPGGWGSPQVRAIGPSKASSGLVVVDPTKLAALDKYGVDQIALKVAWSAIEPSRNRFNWAVIDNYLSRYPNARFTLRIQSGNSAPGWLKALTGTVEVYLASRAQTAHVAHWWKPVAMDAWSNMIHAAGARYNNNPRVVMVSADAPMVVYSEPFILGSDRASGVRLYNAGLNQTTQAAAITRCVNDTCTAFPSTLVELAIHSEMQNATATGISYSWPAGRSLALALCNAHGPHLVLSDYGLGSVDTLANHTPTGTINTEPDVYAWMKLRSTGHAAWAGPVTFQLTVGREPQTRETYRQAAQNAINLGGQQCETSGWGLLGSLATGLDHALKANQVQAELVKSVETAAV